MFISVLVVYAKEITDLDDLAAIHIFLKFRKKNIYSLPDVTPVRFYKPSSNIPAPVPVHTEYQKRRFYVKCNLIISQFGKPLINSQQKHKLLHKVFINTIKDNRRS